MAKVLVSKRIKFIKKRLQKDFISNAKTALKETNLSLSKKLKISPRTLADWTREKFNMSYESAKQISKLSHLPIPKDHTLIEWQKHLKNISHWGGRSVVLKYGKVSRDESLRKSKWREWWNKEGKYNPNIIKIQTSKHIKRPERDLKLAEFIGIMLGDGGITDYTVKITLSSLERQYSEYILKLIKYLFHTEAKITRRKESKAVDILVQRKQLVDFCREIGLCIGNKIKQQVDIPLWIKGNQEFTKVCIRGLIDTDGCFYDNAYVSNNKKYKYFKIAFTSASLPLRSSVAKMLNDLGIKTSINHKDVRISDIQSVKRYIDIIGSHNQKHLDKIRIFSKEKL
jgi:hypothetical protein